VIHVPLNVTFVKVNVTAVVTDNLHLACVWTLPFTTVINRCLNCFVVRW